MNETIYRSEFPNPQFQRDHWLNLNGEWDFEYNCGDKDLLNKPLSHKINLPFCLESPLSNIGYRGFCDCVWYRRAFVLPCGWEKGRVLLRFGAVDYYTRVYVNGESCGFHRGGMTSFCFDISDYLQIGENIITLCVTDRTRSGVQPGGKQSLKDGSHGCFYTRTTGVWQTVWLEHIPADVFIKSIRGVADIDNSTYALTVTACDALQNGTLTAIASLDGVEVTRKTIVFNTRTATMMLEVPDARLWSPASPNLYDLTLELCSAGGCDKVHSYFGMRSVTVRKNEFLLNNQPLFQRLVLDQGFYPDGIWTAPSDDDLRRDIQLSMAAGFNGARLHQKIFEPRFLYWADKLGYLVWGEHGNWGMDYSSESYENFIFEWLEAVERDINHPAIIGWCPFNETDKRQRDDTLALIYRATKAFDPTRPVIDTSGWVHVETDVFDVHDYDQNPQSFRQRYAAMDEGKIFTHYDYCAMHMKLEDVRKLPYFVSEFGGTWWNPDHKEGDSWGYGDRPKTLDEFYERLDGLVSALTQNKNVCGFCYTQLTDVEQEQNGIYRYDRSEKFDMARIAAIFSQTER